ncbi:MAG: AAA family ATPase [Pseudomonadota bacterium]
MTAPPLPADAAHRPSLVADPLDGFLGLALPARPLLLAPWLPAGGLAMLHAPRGLGKSYLALAIAHAVATGGRLFGWRAPAPRPVLYVDGEMPARILQERLAALVACGGPPPQPDDLRIATSERNPHGIPDLAGLAGQRALAGQIGRADLVVLDDFAALFRRGGESQASGWRPVEDFLVALRRLGIAVLLVHHSGKDGRQRGTSRREDALDVVLRLRAPCTPAGSPGARFEVHFDKARGLDPAASRPFLADLDLREGRATWRAGAIGDPLSEAVAALSRQGLSQRAIAAELAISPAGVNRRLAKARAGARPGMSVKKESALLAARRNTQTRGASG